MSFLADLDAFGDNSIRDDSRDKISHLNHPVMMSGVESELDLSKHHNNGRMSSNINFLDDLSHFEPNMESHNEDEIATLKKPYPERPSRFMDTSEMKNERDQAMLGSFNISRAEDSLAVSESSAPKGFEKKTNYKPEVVEDHIRGTETPVQRNPKKIEENLSKKEVSGAGEGYFAQARNVFNVSDSEDEKEEEKEKDDKLFEKNATNASKRNFERQPSLITRKEIATNKGPMGKIVSSNLSLASLESYETKRSGVQRHEKNSQRISSKISGISNLHQKGDMVMISMNEITPTGEQRELYRGLRPSKTIIDESPRERDSENRKVMMRARSKTGTPFSMSPDHKNMMEPDYAAISEAMREERMPMEQEEYAYNFDNESKDKGSNKSINNTSVDIRNRSQKSSSLKKSNRREKEKSEKSLGQSSQSNKSLKSIPEKYKRSKESSHDASRSIKETSKSNKSVSFKEEPAKMSNGSFEKGAIKRSEKSIDAKEQKEEGYFAKIQGMGLFNPDEDSSEDEKESPINEKEEEDYAEDDFDKEEKPNEVDKEKNEYTPDFEENNKKNRWENIEDNEYNKTEENFNETLKKEEETEKENEGDYGNDFEENNEEEAENQREENEEESNKENYEEEKPDSREEKPEDDEFKSDGEEEEVGAKLESENYDMGEFETFDLKRSNKEEKAESFEAEKESEEKSKEEKGAKAQDKKASRQNVNVRVGTKGKIDSKPKGPQRPSTAKAGATKTISKPEQQKNNRDTSKGKENQRQETFKAKRPVSAAVKVPARKKDKSKEPSFIMKSSSSQLKKLGNEVKKERKDDGISFTGIKRPISKPKTDPPSQKPNEKGREKSTDKENKPNLQAKKPVVKTETNPRPQSEKIKKESVIPTTLSVSQEVPANQAPKRPQVRIGRIESKLSGKAKAALTMANLGKTKKDEEKPNEIEKPVPQENKKKEELTGKAKAALFMATLGIKNKKLEEKAKVEKKEEKLPEKAKADSTKGNLESKNKNQEEKPRKNSKEKKSKPQEKENSKKTEYPGFAIEQLDVGGDQHVNKKKRLEDEEENYEYEADMNKELDENDQKEFEELVNTETKKEENDGKEEYGENNEGDGEAKEYDENEEEINPNENEGEEKNEDDEFGGNEPENKEEQNNEEENNEFGGEENNREEENNEQKEEDNDEYGENKEEAENKDEKLDEIGGDNQEKGEDEENNGDNEYGNGNEEYGNEAENGEEENNGAENGVEENNEAENGDEEINEVENGDEEFGENKGENDEGDYNGENEENGVENNANENEAVEYNGENNEGFNEEGENNRENQEGEENQENVGEGVDEEANGNNENQEEVPEEEGGKPKKKAPLSKKKMSKKMEDFNQKVTGMKSDYERKQKEYARREEELYNKELLEKKLKSPPSKKLPSKAEKNWVGNGLGTGVFVPQELFNGSKQTLKGPKQPGKPGKPKIVKMNNWVQYFGGDHKTEYKKKMEEERRLYLKQKAIEHQAQKKVEREQFEEVKKAEKEKIKEMREALKNRKIQEHSVLKQKVKEAKPKLQSNNFVFQVEDPNQFGGGDQALPEDPERPLLKKEALKVLRLMDGDIKSINNCLKMYEDMKKKQEETENLIKRALKNSKSDQMSQKMKTLSNFCGFLDELEQDRVTELELFAAINPRNEPTVALYVVKTSIRGLKLHEKSISEAQKKIFVAFVDSEFGLGPITEPQFINACQNAREFVESQQKEEEDPELDELLSTLSTSEERGKREELESKKEEVLEFIEQIREKIQRIENEPGISMVELYKMAKNNKIETKKVRRGFRSLIASYQKTLIEGTERALARLKAMKLEFNLEGDGAELRSALDKMQEDLRDGLTVFDEREGELSELISKNQVEKSLAEEIRLSKKVIDQELAALKEKPRELAEEFLLQFSQNREQTHAAILLQRFFRGFQSRKISRYLREKVLRRYILVKRFVRRLKQLINKGNGGELGSIPHSIKASVISLNKNFSNLSQKQQMENEEGIEDQNSNNNDEENEEVESLNGREEIKSLPHSNSRKKEKFLSKSRLKQIENEFLGPDNQKLVFVIKIQMKVRKRLGKVPPIPHQITINTFLVASTCQHCQEKPVEIVCQCPVAVFCENCHKAYHMKAHRRRADKFVHLDQPVSLVPYRPPKTTRSSQAKGPQRETITLMLKEAGVDLSQWFDDFDLEQTGELTEHQLSWSLSRLHLKITDKAAEKIKLYGLEHCQGTEKGRIDHRKLAEHFQPKNDSKEIQESEVKGPGNEKGKQKESKNEGSNFKILFGRKPINPISKNRT